MGEQIVINEARHDASAPPVLCSGKPATKPVSVSYSGTYNNLDK